MIVHHEYRNHDMKVNMSADALIESNIKQQVADEREAEEKNHKKK